MNPYSCNHTEQAFSPESKSFLRRQQLLLNLWRLLLLLGAVPGFCLLWRQKSLSDAMIGGLLVISYLLFCLGLRLSGQFRRNAQLAFLPPAVRRDYYAHLCSIAAPKRKPLFQLALAAALLQLQSFSDCLRVLSETDCARMQKSQLSVYWYLQAAANLLTGQEAAYHSALTLLSSVPLFGKEEEIRQERLRALDARDTVYLTAPHRQKELRSQQRKLARNFLFWSAVMLICTLYLCGSALLPDGWVYRDWVSLSGGLFLSAAVFLSVLSLSLSLYRRIRDGNKRAAVTLTAILLTLLCVLTGLGTGLSGFVVLVRSCPEERQADGNLLVTIPIFLDPDRYQVCEAHGWFFREPLTAELSYNPYSESAGSREPAAAEGAESTAAPETKAAEETESAAAPDSAQNPSDADGSAACYEAVCAAEFPEESISYELDAKGNSYVLLGDESEEIRNGQIIKVQKRLVYDRESQNGQCALFVLYRDETGSDGAANTVISDFYAVNRADGTVTPAGKTDWAETGSDAYRAATGE